MKRILLRITSAAVALVFVVLALTSPTAAYMQEPLHIAQTESVFICGGQSLLYQCVLKGYKSTAEVTVIYDRPDVNIGCVITTVSHYEGEYYRAIATTALSSGRPSTGAGFYIKQDMSNAHLFLDGELNKNMPDSIDPCYAVATCSIESFYIARLVIDYRSDSAKFYEPIFKPLL